MRNLALTLRSPSLELALAASAIALVISIVAAIAVQGLPSTRATLPQPEAVSTPWSSDIPTRSVVLGLQKPPRAR